DEPGPSGVQVGNEGAFGCRIDATSALDLGATPDGWTGTPADAAAIAVGSWSGTYTPAAGDPFPLTLDVTTTGDGQWIDTGPEEASCDDYAAIPATLVIDGGPDIAATIEGELAIRGADRFTLHGEVDQGEVTGTMPLGLDASIMAYVNLRLWSDYQGDTLAIDLGYVGCTSGDECSPPSGFGEGALTRE
ncbi:MAG: hypothetical protein ABMB14_33395, partial [Myxococcota bacterium]